MSAMTPDEVAGRRVDEKLARSNERLERNYSRSDAAERNVSNREKFLQSRALTSLGGSSPRESHAH